MCNKLYYYNEAILEAERFIAKAQDAVEAISDEQYYNGGQFTAAAKRSSMDLTKALAKLRGA
tara:strand:+ start:550 stop:735 length:186 start_codon:yes stop_codon:yes gene_type:complete